MMAQKKATKSNARKKLLTKAERRKQYARINYNSEQVKGPVKKK